MGFHGTVEVYGTEKLSAPIGAAFRTSLTVPHVHLRSDNAFNFAVSLNTIHTVFPVSFAESVITSSFKLAIPRGLATGNIIVCVFEVSVARRFWFSAP